MREFLGCCRTEFSFLADYGFREMPAITAEHPDPFRFRMVGEFLELYAHGIDYGSHTHVLLRDCSGHELSVSQLESASRAATRLVRRSRPDGQRADIAAAARALRDFPAVLSSRDLTAATGPTPNDRNA